MADQVIETKFGTKSHLFYRQHYQFKIWQTFSGHLVQASAPWTDELSYCQITWGSGPLLCMARVLVPLRRLLMLILNVSLLVEYYTLKQQTEIVIIWIFIDNVKPSFFTWGSGPLLRMARVLVLGKLLVLITIICWIFYTLKQPTEITSGYPWSIPIRLNIFSYELSLIGTFLRWAPRDDCIAPG